MLDPRLVSVSLMRDDELLIWFAVLRLHGEGSRDRIQLVLVTMEAGDFQGGEKN